MRRIESKLKPRERLFCYYFVCTGDAELSAKKAGYKRDCELDGMKMLCNEKILNEIRRLISLRKTTLSKLASVGYRRLAFGGISDALRLLYMEQPTDDELKNMDLFMVSEIKKPKNGMLEIKFFDRLKALEKLESKSEETSEAEWLFDAIGRQAENGRDDIVS